MQSIEALRFEVEEVGKHLKGSKKRYCWQIALKEKMHKIQLDFSFISSKVKIVVDRKILLQNELPSNVSFQYPFTLDGFALNIIQQGETFQLRINNKVFSHLYIQKKTNTEFKKYEEEIKDIKVDFNQHNKKNISLNIGALGGTNMKKKKQVNESQGWNAMAGPGAFPNYFGQNQTQQKKQQLTSSSHTNNTSGDLFSFTESKVQKSQNLLDEPSIVKTKSSTPSQSFFQFDAGTQKYATQVSKVNQPPSEDLFSSFNLNSQKNSDKMDFFAEELNKNNDKMNFFAEEPKKVQVVQIQNSKENSFFGSNKDNNGMLDINFGNSPSGINMTGFATGYGVQPKSKINANNFATSNHQQLTDLSFDMFANTNSVAKPAQNNMNFAKKLSTNPQQSSILTQLDSLSLNTPSNVAPNVHNHNFNGAFTNIPLQNIANIDLNDFSTMQLMFQTNSAANSLGGFQQQHFATNSQINTAPYAQPVQPIQPVPTVQPNLTGLSLNMSPTIGNATKPQLSSFDFSSSKPSSQFNTSSGVFNMQSNINENKFSTYQFNPNQSSDLQFNFLQTKPKNTAVPSNDLI